MESRLGCIKQFERWVADPKFGKEDSTEVSPFNVGSGLAPPISPRRQRRGYL